MQKVIWFVPPRHLVVIVAYIGSHVRSEYPSMECARTAIQEGEERAVAGFVPPAVLADIWSQNSSFM